MVDDLFAYLWSILSRCWNPKSHKNQSENEVGKQCQGRNNQNGQGSANERLQRAAKPVVQAQGGRDRGSGKPLPRGLKVDYLPLNHLSPEG